MRANTVIPSIVKTIQRTGSGTLLSTPYDWMKIPNPPPTRTKTGRGNFARRGLFHASKSAERRRDRSLLYLSDTFRVLDEPNIKCVTIRQQQMKQSDTQAAKRALRERYAFYSARHLEFINS